MDGIHDLGGMHGFGRVEREPDEPLFHAPWERRVLGLMIRLLAGGWFNIDAFRHGIETIPPLEYLRCVYYARWRRSVEKNLIAAGAVTRDELEARTASLREGRAPAPAAARAVRTPAERVPGFVRELERPPRFGTGDRVRARNLHPSGHTRLPGYARGRSGRVERVYPPFVFPDTNAHGLGESPQHLYHVRFDAGELFGDGAEARTSVGVDLFEPYLEAAP